MLTLWPALVFICVESLVCKKIKQYLDTEHWIVKAVILPSLVCPPAILQQCPSHQLMMVSLQTKKESIFCRVHLFIACNHFFCIKTPGLRKDNTQIFHNIQQLVTIQSKQNVNAIIWHFYYSSYWTLSQVLQGLQSTLWVLLWSEIMIENCSFTNEKCENKGSWVHS